MTDPRSVLIAGAGTGAHWNVGDAAILSGMVHRFREIDPGLRPAIVTANPPGTLSPWDVDEIRFDSMPAILAAAEHASLLALGGGGLFFDYWDFPANELLTPSHAGISFYAGFAMLATLLRKPLMIYAAGVGPLRTEAGRRLTRATFEQADAITVRDSDSATLLEELGIPRARVTVTADPAFELEPASPERAEEILTRAGAAAAASPRVAVCVRGWSFGTSPEQWQAELAKGLDTFLERHGGSAVFVPFHRAVGEDDDEAAAAGVIGRMSQRKRTVALGSGYTPEEVSALIGRCDLLVGMRLHSIVFAQSHAVPSIAIVYDPKVRSAMGSRLARFALALEQINGNEMAALLREAFERRDELSSELRAERGAQVAAAVSNGTIAASVLGGSAGARERSASTRTVIEELALRQLRRTVELEETIRGLEAEIVQKQEGIEWLRSEVRLRDERIAELLRASRESR